MDGRSMAQNPSKPPRSTRKNHAEAPGKDLYCTIADIAKPSAKGHEWIFDSGAPRDRFVIVLSTSRSVGMWLAWINQRTAATNSIHVIVQILCRTGAISSETSFIPATRALRCSSSGFAGVVGRGRAMVRVGRMLLRGVFGWPICCCGWLRGGARRR